MLFAYETYRIISQNISTYCILTELFRLGIVHLVSVYRNTINV